MLDLEELKNFLKKIIAEKALGYLNEVKSKHSKLLHITHKQLKIQAYLEPKNLVNSQLAKFLFQARSSMLECKLNFRQKYKKDELHCPLQCEELDSQQHLLDCDRIPTQCLSSQNLAEYDDIFTNNVKKQICAAAILNERLKARKKALDGRNLS